jgi:hypothetical protein
VTSATGGIAEIASSYALTLFVAVLFVGARTGGSIVATAASGIVGTANDDDALTFLARLVNKFVADFIKMSVGLMKVCMCKESVISTFEELQL